MRVRGAPLIGVRAAYGIALPFRESSFRDDWKTALGNRCKLMKSARPTTVNLSFAVDSFWQAASGAKAASSESLSHAACYLGNDSVSVVIHIHDAMLWERAQTHFPVTDPGAEYGTPAMAHAVGKLSVAGGVRTHSYGWSS